VTAVVAGDSILVVSLVQLDTESAECRDWLTHTLNGDDLYILANQTLLEVSAALRRLGLEEKIEPEWAENFHRRSSDPLFIRQQLTSAQMGRIGSCARHPLKSMSVGRGRSAPDRTVHHPTYARRARVPSVSSYSQPSCQPNSVASSSTSDWPLRKC